MDTKRAPPNCGGGEVEGRSGCLYTDLPPQGPPQKMWTVSPLLLLGKQMSTCPRRPVCGSNPANSHRKWLWTAPGVVSSPLFGPGRPATKAYGTLCKPTNCPTQGTKCKSSALTMSRKTTLTFQLLKVAAWVIQTT